MDLVKITRAPSDDFPFLYEGGRDVYTRTALFRGQPSLIRVTLECVWPSPFKILPFSDSPETSPSAGLPSLNDVTT